MIKFTRKQLDTPIAELEYDGLPVGIVGMLENHHKVVFIRDLIGVAEKDLRRGGWMEIENTKKLKACLQKWYERTKGK